MIGRSREAHKGGFRVTLLVLFEMVIILQPCLDEYVPYINYGDEVLTVLLVVVYLFGLRTNTPLKRLLIPLLLIMAIILGTLGNLFFYQRDLLGVCVDAIGLMKPFSVLLVVWQLWDGGHVRSLIVAMRRLLQAIIYLAAVFYIPAMFLFPEMFTQQRFGIGTYGFVFGAGVFGYIASFAYCFFGLDTDMPLRRFSRALSLVLAVLSLKGPALVFVALVAVQGIVAKRRRLSVLDLCFMVVLVAMVGFYQVQEYLLDTTAARYIINETSLELAIDHFPLGSGLATFGCEMSRWPYSQVYNDYGISSVYGLDPVYGLYINDNYFAMLLGQLGFIGFALFISIFIYLFHLLNRKPGESMWTQRRDCMALYLSVIVGAVGSAYMTGAICLAFMLPIACYLNLSMRGGACLVEVKQ